MPATTVDPRKKSDDTQSSSFRAPSKTEIDQYVRSLDPEGIGADSPELILKRARYQATRDLAQAPQKVADTEEGEAPNNGQALLKEEPMSEQTLQPALATVEDENNQTDPKKTEDSSESGESKEKIKDTEKETSKPKGEEDNEKTAEEPEKKLDSKGGGSEKKDTGVTPQQLPQSQPSQKQASKQNEGGTSKSDSLNRAKAQAVAEIKNVQDKLKSGDLSGAVEGGVTAGSKIASSWALTAMWGAVWLDWTLLTLLGLNVYFVVSNFTDKIASFGEDYLFGKWMPKELAKWFEIILLALLDMIIFSIIFMILYGGYKFFTASFFETFWGAAKGVITGEGAGVGAAKQILRP